MAYNADKRPAEWASAEAVRLAARHDEAAQKWARGAQAESVVGYALERLRRLGFAVMHDLPQVGEGNVDHLVSGPSGVFMIETKRWRYEPDHLLKARRQAAKLASELGVWVTPVICLATRARGRPYLHDGVWIVRRKLLLDWLVAQRNPVLRLERLARFVDGL